MTTINLKDFYYWYTQDQFIEVSDEVAEVFVSDARHEMAYQRRLSRHKAQYSLDCDDGIEYSACLHEPTPQEEQWHEQKTEDCNRVSLPLIPSAAGGWANISGFPRRT